MSSTKYEYSDNSLMARLELLRGDRSQKEFAEWIGESPTTVNGYFTGSSRPKIDFLRSMAMKGININWFLTGQGHPYIIEQKNLDTLESIPALLDMKHLTDKFIGNVAETIAEYKTKAKELQERKKLKK